MMGVVNSVIKSQFWKNKSILQNTSAFRLLALRKLRTLRVRTRAFDPRVAGGMQVYSVAGGVRVYSVAGGMQVYSVAGSMRVYSVAGGVQ